MSNSSLQQQLLKKGLIDKKKLNAISKEKHNALKNKNRKKSNATDNDQSAALTTTQQAHRAQKARDRELNLQHQKRADKKAIAAQIIQLVEQYKLDRDNAEIEYNFNDANIVKKIPVSKNVSQEISRGRLCIVRLGQSYEVVPRPIADKIQERDADAIVVANQNDSNPKDSDSNEDYYAQFEIPDDLIW